MSLTGKARMRPGLALVIAVISIGANVVLSGAAASADEPGKAGDIILVPLEKAFSVSPAAREIYENELAGVCGRNGEAGMAPVLPSWTAVMRDGLAFYSFFDTYRDAASTKEYVIQRVRKTTLLYRSANDSRPETNVEYLVEIFKTRNGELKRPDMHHGTYSLGGAYRRVVLKELEIGTGEIAGQVSGDRWPFDQRQLYHEIKGYSQDRAAYDAVRFDRSTAWWIRADFDETGRYDLTSSALPKKAQ